MRLQLRLDAALALYRDGRVPRIVVSGGQDPGSPPEAEVMKAYLVARGVQAADVIEDRGGINTFETARFVADHVHRHGLRSGIAVSQYYHLSRCKLALRRFGVPEVHGAHAPLRLEPREPRSWAREVVGFYARSRGAISRATRAFAPRRPDALRSGLPAGRARVRRPYRHEEPRHAPRSPDCHSRPRFDPLQRLWRLRR